MTTMNQLSDSTMFFGGNAPFVEELYENYLDNPTAVPAEWRDYFDRLAQMPGFVARDVAHAPVIAAFTELAKDGGFRPAATVSGGDIKKQSAVGQLVTAYRSMGTRWAELDPLKRLPRPKIDELELGFYGFNDADLNQPFNVGSLKGLPETAKLLAISSKPSSRRIAAPMACRVHVHHRLRRKALVARAPSKVRDSRPSLYR
jgi:2-oxoglutarate dehydrogenase E1 component